MILKRIISSQQFLDQTYSDLCELLKRHGHYHIEVKEGQRSLSQNNLYWRWLTQIGPAVNEKWGLGWDKKYEKDMAHDLMRHLHLGYRQIPKMGATQVPDQLKSTTDCSASEMAEYMTKVDAWCVQYLNLLLERPEDSEYAKYREANQ
jgi:hypothetical protein